MIFESNFKTAFANSKGRGGVTAGGKGEAGGGGAGVARPRIISPRPARPSSSLLGEEEGKEGGKSRQGWGT